MKGRRAMSEYELKPEEARLYLVSLQAKCDRLRNRKRRATKREKLFLIVHLSLFVSAIVVSRFVHNSFFGMGLLLAALQSVRAIIIVLEPSYHSHRFTPDESENVNRAIADAQEIEYIGLFADALSLDVGQDRTPLREALTRLLPQLTDKNANLLNVQQRHNLNRGLQAGTKSGNYEGGDQFHASKFADYCIAIMQAFSVVGDKASVKTVEKLALMKPESEQQGRVRNAARYYLPLIQQRAQEEDNSAILLRASDTGTLRNQLLRPAASSANETDAQQLLRAATSEES